MLAARWLGLTTQVPGRPCVAVPGRVPVAVHGVRFCSRTPRRRELGMNALEVAVVEVLRDWPLSVEASWGDAEGRTDTAIAHAYTSLDDAGRERTLSGD